MCARIYARMYARAYDCRTTQERRTRTTGHGTPPEQRGTQDHDQHTTEKERNTGKPAHIGIIAGTEKKYKKKLRKIWKYEKNAVSLLP